MKEMGPAIRRAFLFGRFGERRGGDLGRGLLVAEKRVDAVPLVLEIRQEVALEHAAARQAEA